MSARPLTCCGRADRPERDTLHGRVRGFPRLACCRGGVRSGRGGRESSARSFARCQQQSRHPASPPAGEGARRAEEGLVTRCVLVQFASRPLGPLRPLLTPPRLSLSSALVPRVARRSGVASGFPRRWSVRREVSTASRGRVTVLLLAQEKVTKEKGTPGGPPCGHPVLRVREPVPGFADRTSCAVTSTRTSVSASLRADPSPSHRT